MITVRQVTGELWADDQFAPTESRWHRWRADIVGLLGVLSIVILLGHRLLGPQVSIPADIIDSLSPWGAISVAPFHNGILHDIPLTVYPNRVIVNKEIQGGHFPLWDPYSGMGQPGLGDTGVALFYPSVLALSWLSPAHALNIETFIHLLIVALGMYVLVRIWGGRPIGALAATAAFAASSLLTTWQQYGIAFAIQAWLPWLVICLTMAQRGNRLAWLGAGSLVMGILGIADVIQWTIYDLLFLGCYALLLGVQSLRGGDWRRIARPMIDLVVIGAIGLGIGMVQFIPFVELAMGSPRANLQGYAYIKSTAAPLSQTLTLFAPNFFGTPTVGYSLFGWSLLANGGFYAENTIFFGFFPVLIALFAPIWRRTRLVWLLWGFMLAMASFVFGTLTIHLLAILPAFNHFKPARMSYLLCFAGAALCGIVFSDLFHDRRAWRPLAIIGGAALAVRGALHLALLYYRGSLPKITTPTQQNIHWVTVMTIAGVVIFAAVAVSRKSIVRTAMSISLMLFVVADMALFNIPFNEGSYDENQIFPRPTVISALPTSVAPPRVAAINQPDSLVLFTPDSLAVYRVSELGAHSSLLIGSYLDYMEHLEHRDMTNESLVGLHNYTSPLLDLAGAEYLFSNVPLDAAGQQLDLITADQYVYLYRNRQAAPRPFIVTNVTAATSPAELWSVLDAPGFTPCAVAVVEAPRAPLPVTSSEGGCVGNATFTRYESNRIDIRAETPTEGLLVLSDTYYPGWHVTVDGKSQKIYKTDGTFRGVLVPSGIHDIRFTYRPATLYWAGAVSIISLLSGVTLLIIGKFGMPLLSRLRQRRQVKG